MAMQQAYHTSSPSDDDSETYTYPAKLDDADIDEEPHNALTSQTLNADGTPKRPMNAFMIFARRRRPQVSAENQSMRTGDISKILSQEWKAMPATEKQFYQNQAKQLKETFNSKYPDYVYKRRPNNTRKRRQPNVGVPAGVRGDRDTDGESSPDAEDAPPLPDHHSRYYGSASSNGSYSSYGGPYGGGGGSYGGGGHGNGHARHSSYPYPPTTDSYRYDSASRSSLLHAPHYPAPTPYDAATSTSSHNSHLGLRKAQSNPTMPLSPPLSWSAPPPAPAASSSPYSGYNSSYASAPNAASYSPGSRYATVPDSPGARYSPFAGTSASASSTASASPAPGSFGTSYATSSSYTSASDSPGHTFASINGAGGSAGYSSGGSVPRALVNGSAGGGLGGGSDYYWRPEAKLQ